VLQLDRGQLPERRGPLAIANVLCERSSEELARTVIVAAGDVVPSGRGAPPNERAAVRGIAQPDRILRQGGGELRRTARAGACRLVVEERGHSRVSSLGREREVVGALER